MRTCPSCAFSELPEHARFCPGCGAPLPVPESVVQAPPVETTPLQTLPLPGKKSRFSETLWFSEGESLDQVEDPPEYQSVADPESFQARYEVEKPLDQDTRRKFSLNPEQS